MRGCNRILRDDSIHLLLRVILAPFLNLCINIARRKHRISIIIVPSNSRFLVFTSIFHILHIPSTIFFHGTIYAAFKDVKHFVHEMLEDHTPNVKLVGKID